MLQAVIYSFPRTAAGKEFFGDIARLFHGLPNARVEGETITFVAAEPVGSLPVTVFALHRDIAFPEVQFGMNGELSLEVGDLHIGPTHPLGREIKGKISPKALKRDSLGSYYAVTAPGQMLFRLPMAELCARLESHVVRIDHTGINFPASLVPKDVWSRFVTKIAQECNMYRYPTGEDWPFILPATPEENAQEITAFPVGREPKCELVYDTFSPVPSIQIDIETDLPRQEVERLFPEPYGVSFPDLADYFRTVYIGHEWPGLNIRFDIRFKNDKPDGDWETGKWLVNSGGRI